MLTHGGSVVCCPRCAALTDGLRCEFFRNCKPLADARGSAILEVFRGPLAQLGERCVRNAEVGGSIPPRSTNQFGGIGIQARVTSSTMVSPIINANHMNPPTTTSFVKRVL